MRLRVRMRRFPKPIYPKKPLFGYMERLTRRDFAKAAVAVGGASALSACLDRGGGAEVPQGGGSVPERQHAWNEYMETDDHGNEVMPRHHVLLHLDYTGEDPEDDRPVAEAAFSSLESAYDWSSDGLLFTVGYSSYYFDAVDADDPSLPEPRPLASFENPSIDSYDAVIHLASDHASAVLEAEEALLGEVKEPNGVGMEEDLTGVFERADRRTGFIGKGLPAEKHDGDLEGMPDSEPVSEDSPLFMGFKSGFEKNQASEDFVTVEEGPFEGGTTQQISRINLDLEQWYEQDSRYQRVAKMFCPAHADEGRVEGVGENLGDSSGVDECPVPHENARTHGTVGHSQKLSEEREDDSPLMIRRDFDTTDYNRAGVHFLSLQETIDDFVKTREAMNAEEVVEGTAVGSRNNNGILQYITVQSRGNYVVPPRELRSLPTVAP